MSERIPLWQPNVRYRKQMGGRITLVNGVEVYQLDEIPNLIWGKCDGKNSVESITQHIVDQYDVDLETAQQDCKTFLDDLVQANLITWV